MILLPLALSAQAVSSFAHVDKKVLGMPAQKEITLEALSGFINQQFKSPEDRARAAFMWLAQNVAYDVVAFNSAAPPVPAQQVIAQTLAQRKAVCQGYAEVFQALCTRAGIPNYLVSGYTKQQGTVDYVAHAWVAAQLNGQWLFFDPTWGAGYVNGNLFVKKLNENYFKVTSAQMIKSHYPFDPLWQFSTSPIKAREFNTGQPMPKAKKPFLFADTLKTHAGLSEFQQLAGTVRRMEAHGADNPFIVSRLTYLKQGLDIQRYNQLTDTFNQGVDLLNQFIYYRNNRLLNTKSPETLSQMLSTTVATFNTVKQQLTATRWHQSSQNLVLLEQNLGKVMTQAQQQEAFLANYFQKNGPSQKR
ncbi:transglutaminase domain-containing protein [Rufibacter sp. LB8]|uniref:transglutaminase domain-containing protein n=1 Tax=Rufibacter sp. LB8 TaxID=2777781 RepID=UPI00178C31B6|nr:transglutaminase domain-containing protein [Rufibacter sp. LB8]